MLSLRQGAVVSASGRPLLAGIDLEAPAPGLLFVVGPAGVGKSSLLRGMAGHGPLEGELRLAGEVPTRPVYLGQRDSRAAQNLVPLSAAERRTGAVLDALARDADWYLLDEPTAGLDEAQAARVRGAIAARARHALVVVVTHNRRDCLALGGQLVLLGGGRVLEVAPVHEFFANPASAAGRDYVASGSCRESSPAWPVQHGIWWAVPGMLAGLSRPGLVADAGVQFDALAAHGVREMFCLETEVAWDREALRARGIALRHVPVPDMAPPSFDQALALCRAAEACIRRGGAVAMHCQGGLGRTGVALAAVLAWFGDSAEVAIARVRAAQPRAIQSRAQHQFIHAFSGRIAGWNPVAPIVAPTRPQQGVVDVAR